MPDVVVFGDINLDIIARIPRYPAPGGDGLAAYAVIRPGGAAANFAAVLARLGVTVRLIGRVGRDPLAEMVLDELAGGGVDLSAVQRDPAALTGVMFIPVTPDGERTLFGSRGANGRAEPQGISPGALAGIRLFHLSGYALLESPQREAAGRALALARDAGAILSLDAGLEAATRCAGEIRSLLPGLGVLLGNAAEMSCLSGESNPILAARKLVSAGVQTVAVKLGPGGCVVASTRGWARLPGFEVDAVDSTGAGDAFDAGFAYGTLHGLSRIGAALLANAAGAVVATRVGATPPAPDEMKALLRSHGDRPDWGGLRAELPKVLAIL